MSEESGVPDWATEHTEEVPHGPFVLEYPSWMGVALSLISQGHPDAARMVLEELDRQTGETGIPLKVLPPSAFPTMQGPLR